MARKLRIQYAGAIYHVMNRGDRQEAIFKDEKDHLLFLQTLEQVCEKTGWTVHAMPNSCHSVAGLASWACDAGGDAQKKNYFTRSHEVAKMKGENGIRSEIGRRHSMVFGSLGISRLCVLGVLA
jgi:hypothetical protein